MPITDARTQPHPKPRRPCRCGIEREWEMEMLPLSGDATVTQLPIKVKFTAFKSCLIMNHHHCNPSQTFLMKCLFCAKLWLREFPSLIIPMF